jgi:hypothetical protein
MRERLVLASREFGSDFELTDGRLLIFQHRAASRAWSKLWMREWKGGALAVVKGLGDPSC